MNARLPVIVRRFEADGHSPEGRLFGISTREAEVEEADSTEDPIGLLPQKFGTVAGLSNAVIEQVEEAGYDPEDYPVEVGEEETVLWAVVSADPRETDGSEWVEFEEVYP